LEKLDSKASELIFSNQKILQNLGAILCFDVLINNWDRYPLIWKNDGNPNNIIYNTSSLEIFAIDSTISSIDKKLAPENYKNHLNEIKNFIELISAEKAPHLNKIREFVKKHSNYELSDKDLENIKEGMQRTAEKIAETSPNIFRDCLSKVEAKLVKTIKVLGFQQDFVGMYNVNLEFLEEVLALFGTFTCKYCFL
jgi:hypothetical protein